MAGGDVDPLGALEVVIPVPLFPGVLLDEGDGVAHLLGGVLLHVVLPVAQGRGQLEAGDAVLQLQSLGDDAVAHQGAVAGGVALDGTGAQNGGVIINGHTHLRLRHGTHVTGKAKFLGHIDVVLCRMLVQQHGDIGGGSLPAQTLDGGKAHEHGGHFVFVHQHDLLGKLLVVSDAPIPPEQVVQELRHVLDDQILLQVADAKVLVPQALGMPVHHHGHCQVVGHPAVAEHGLDVSGLDDKAGQGAHDVEPPPVVIHGVPEATPFPALANLAPGIEIAQAILAHFLSHFLHLPGAS